MAATLPRPAVHPQGAPTLAGVLSAVRSHSRSYGLALGTGLSAIALLLSGQPAVGSVPAAGTVPLALATAAGGLERSIVSNGVVDRIRELPAEVRTGARRFEMTIRMRDGTMRVSNETGSARWQAGDGVRMFGSTAGT